MKKSYGYYLLIFFLSITAIAILTSDIFQIKFHTQIMYLVAILAYIVGISVVQFLMHNSPSMTVVINFAAPVLLMGIAMVLGSILETVVPAYKDFYRHLSGEPAGVWLLLPCFMWSWFLAILSLIFGIIYKIAEFAERSSKK